MRDRAFDNAAFEQLYRAEADSLLIWFTRRTLDKEASLDLVAETFALAYEGRRRLRRRELDSASRWLWGVAKNQLKRYWRKGKVDRRAVARLGMQRPSLTQNDHAELERLSRLADLRRLLEGALAEISDPQSEAIRLRVIDEKPYEEIAEELGVDADAVRARVSRGLRKLQRILEGSGALQEINEMEAT